MRVVAFPSDDKEFGAHVQRSFDALESPSPAALEEVIGRLYPLVSVQPRHPLAEFSDAHRDETWYVFRDGLLVTDEEPGASEGLFGLESA
jgi:hypothetical protein